MKLQFLVIVTAGLLLAADDAKDDHETIQGTWKAVAVEDSGQKTPEAALKAINVKWVIGKDKIAYQVGKMTTEWTYKLDPTKKPKWIDLKEGDRAMPGIYELDGDTLKVCYPERGKGKRSTAFESKPDSVNDVLVVLRREKR
jgi:uncharacterized protein (TIGR03067 family)